METTTCQICKTREARLKDCVLCQGTGRTPNEILEAVQKTPPGYIPETMKQNVCFICKGSGKIWICSTCYEKITGLESEKADVNSEQKTGCFIATTVYGSPMAKEVYFLQNFRDEFLLKSSFGRFFVSTYYLLSPPIAKIVSGSDFLRNVVRTLIISPLLRIAKRDLLMFS